jgi:hypothetical protein
MADRRITFIDADENPLVVSLKDDRVQLFVVDGEPELAADELRGFALALFATYVGPALTTRLAAARTNLGGVRDALVAAGATDAVLAALDGSLRAIEDVAQGLTLAGAAVTPDPAPITPAWPAWPTEPPEPEPPGLPGPAVRSMVTARSGSRKPTRPRRAREAELLGWGWRRDRGDDPPPGGAA